MGLSLHVGPFLPLVPFFPFLVRAEKFDPPTRRTSVCDLTSRVHIYPFYTDGFRTSPSLLHFFSQGKTFYHCSTTPVDVFLHGSAREVRDAFLASTWGTSFLTVCLSLIISLLPAPLVRFQVRSTVSEFQLGRLLVFLSPALMRRTESTSFVAPSF